MKQFQITESINREFGKYIGDNYYYVVNDFNRFQQDTILQLQKLNIERNKTNSNKSFINIIHNYKNLITVEDI